jgi:hypothetical protein
MHAWHVAPPRRLLIALLLALALLQLLHLLDDLRTEPTITLFGALLTPLAVAGVGGALLAAALVARRQAWAGGLARAVAGLVALGFVVVHGAPFKAGPLRPYWGAGSADAVQWLGVMAILVCCGLVLLAARRLGRVQPSA